MSLGQARSLSRLQHTRICHSTTLDEGFCKLTQDAKSLPLSSTQVCLIILAVSILHSRLESHLQPYGRLFTFVGDSAFLTALLLTVVILGRERLRSDPSRWKPLVMCYLLL